MTDAERVKYLTFHLEQIASGAARDARVQAKVALGDLPIGALLTPADSEIFCEKCKNKGRTVKGQGNNYGQRFGCSGCGYLEGEHPNGPKQSVQVNNIQIHTREPEPQIVFVPVDRGGGGGMRA